MKVETNCKNCGAILVGQVCQYCGSDYRVATPSYSLPVIHCDSERLAIRMSIDPFEATYMDREQLSSFIKSQMVQKLANMLVDQLKYSSRTNFETDRFEICGTFDVVKKGSYFVDREEAKW